jgi:hypothetical protein
MPRSIPPKTQAKLDSMYKDAEAKTQRLNDLQQALRQAEMDALAAGEKVLGALELLGIADFKWDGEHVVAVEADNVIPMEKEA